MAAIPFTGVLIAQSASFDGRPAVILRNDKIELTVLPLGATLANLTLRDDTEKLSPYWNSDRAQAGGTGTCAARPDPRTLSMPGWIRCAFR